MTLIEIYKEVLKELKNNECIDEAIIYTSIIGIGDFNFISGKLIPDQKFKANEIIVDLKEKFNINLAMYTMYNKKTIIISEYNNINRLYRYYNWIIDPNHSIQIGKINKDSIFIDLTQ